MANIIIIDDHPMFREGIASLIEKSPHDNIVASLPDVSGVDEIITSTSPPVVVLMDISLRDGASHDKIKQLKADHRDLLVVVVTMHDDAQTVRRAMQAGADGYTLKRDVFEDLVFAIRSAERGGRFISPTVMRAGSMELMLKQPEDRAALPMRQKQILALLAQGKSNKQIAADLGIALPTVKNHLSALFKRYNATSRLSLLASLDALPMGTDT